MQGKASLSIEEQTRLDQLNQALSLDLDEQQMFYTDEETRNFIESDAFKDSLKHLGVDETEGQMIFLAQAGVEFAPKDKHGFKNVLTNYGTNITTQDYDKILADAKNNAGTNWNEEEALIELAFATMEKYPRDRNKFHEFLEMQVVEGNLSHDKSLLLRSQYYIENPPMTKKEANIYNILTIPESERSLSQGVQLLEFLENNKNFSTEAEALAHLQELKQNAIEEVFEGMTGLDPSSYNVVASDTCNAKRGCNVHGSLSHIKGVDVKYVTDAISGESLYIPTNKGQILGLTVYPSGGSETMVHEGGHGIQVIDQGNLIAYNKLPQGGRCVNDWSLCMDIVATTMSGLSYIKSDGSDQSQADYTVQEIELAPQIISLLMEPRKMNWLNKYDSYGFQQLQELYNYSNSAK